VDPFPRRTHRQNLRASIFDETLDYVLLRVMQVCPKVINGNGKMSDIWRRVLVEIPRVQLLAIWLPFRTMMSACRSRSVSRTRAACDEFVVVLVDREKIVTRVIDDREPEIAFRHQVVYFLLAE